MSEHRLGNKKQIERIYLVADFGIRSLVCKSNDVAQLEAHHAKLEATNAELLEALEYVRAVLPPLVSLDNAKKMLDAAIAKAKQSDDNQTTTTNGEQP